MKNAILSLFFLMGTFFLCGVTGFVGYRILVNLDEPTDREIVSTAFSNASLPTSAEAATLVQEVVQATEERKFEELDRCEQLDVIAKQGESVANFIAESGFSLYEPSISFNCPWHKEQLDLAYNILNPPVIHVEPVVIEQSVRNLSNVSDESYPTDHPTWFGAADRGIWNNCNGVREYGESYSSACHNWQVRNVKERDTVDLGYEYN